MLLRSIFENLLNLEIILKEETQERLNLYYEYRPVERWINLEENKKLAKKSEDYKNKFHLQFPEKRIEEIIHDFNKVKDNYNPKRPYHWAWKIYKNELGKKNPSIKFLCEKVGRLSDYTKIYSSLSISVHGSANIENLIKIGDSITITPRFSEQIYLIGGLSILYISDTIVKIIDYLNIPKKEEIIIYSKTFALDIYNEAQNNSAMLK